MIRRATAADSALVRAITRVAYAKWVPLIGREPLPMTADYDHAVSAHLIDILERDGHAAGLVEMIPAADFLMIENIAVLPEQQGKGIGGLLLAHAEKTARQLALPELRLFTNLAFSANIAFYASRGFIEYARQAIPSGGELIHMKKPISRLSREA